MSNQKQKKKERENKEKNRNKVVEQLRNAETVQ